MSARRIPPAGSRARVRGLLAFYGGLRDLFAPLDDLLARGGDPRLTLDPIGRVNDYGCGPSPAPETLQFRLEHGVDDLANAPMSAPGWRARS